MDDDDEMDVDISFGAGDDSDDGEDVDMNDEDEEGDGQEVQPMPVSGGIQELRDRLHARMAALRRGGRGSGDAGWEAGSRDELIEERRRQRAALREKRRKETKEKIKRESEARGKKGKEKEQQRNAGPTTKVCATVLYFRSYCDLTFTNSNNSSFPTNPLPQGQEITPQPLTLLSPSSPMLPRAKSNVTRLLPILPKHFHKLLLVKKNSPPCQKTSGKRGKRGRSGKRPKRGWRVLKCMTMKDG